MAMFPSMRIALRRRALIMSKADNLQQLKLKVEVLPVFAQSPSSSPALAK
jgi:hypothetical protein